MALVRKPAAAAAVAPGGFEGMDGDTATADATTLNTAPAATAPAGLEPKASVDANTAGVAATTAIAKAATTGVGKVARYVPAYTTYANVISPEDIEAIGSGTFPRVTCDVGGAQLDKREELGKVIKLELVSWNYRYVVTTGAKTDDSEANALVRFSYDGETISGTGQKIAEYIAFLKMEGYDKANVKTYLELWGNLSAKNGQDISPETRQMVQVQLSPQSVNQFKRFQLEKGMKISRGFCEEDPMITLTVEKKTIAPNSFGIFVFS